MRKFIVVSFTQPDFPQEFPDQDWPFHVTLISSFKTELPEEELGRRLGEACARHAPIEVRGVRREMFGPKRDVPVTEVSCPAELLRLRASLLHRYGDGCAWTHVPYPTYRPHVTDQRGESLAVGAPATLSSASLVEKVGEQRIVVATSPLLIQ